MALARRRCNGSVCSSPPTCLSKYSSTSRLPLIHLSISETLAPSALGFICSSSHTTPSFRVIRAPLLSPVWKKLAANRSLAQNVRVLEVQSAELHDDDDLRSTVDAPVIPTIFADLEGPLAPEMDDDAEGGRWRSKSLLLGEKCHRP